MFPTSGRKIGVVTLAVVASTLATTGCGGSSSESDSSSPGSAPASNITPRALITTKHAGKLGTVLAFGTKRLTVYLFEADRPGRSTCRGACAKVWPPLTGSPKAIRGAVRADLGTITRADGTKQVTYNGHPLYLYINDRDAGDSYGEGSKSFGAGWYAIDRSGKKVDHS
jgi:predicted lipoprotein with Yx(FWY)xxD motif